MNPTDLLQGMQNSFVAVVVDDKDKDKCGRFLCRIIGPQDDKGKVPDKKLAWVQAVTNGQPQSRTVGMFPPLYRVGSQVLLQATGQQQYQIVGSYTNNETADGKRDMHPGVVGEEMKVNIPGLFHTYRTLLQGKPFADFPTDTESALNIMNQKVQSTLLKGSPLESIADFAKIPDVFGGRIASKVKAGEFLSAGSLKFLGEVKDIQKFMKGNGLQEMVPNALGMLGDLKKTAQAGQALLASTSVGGLLNIAGALKGIASSHAANNSRDDAADEALALLEFLLKLYKEITGKEPKDENGNLTVKFLKWKEKYMNGEIAES